MDNILKKIPSMLFGNELKNELAYFPYIDRKEIVTKSQGERLIMLNELYSFYYPTKYTVEIYTKIYLALVRALQKKQSKLVVRQQYNNYFALHKKGELNGIIGGADSFSVIGASGVGKTSAISKVIEVVSNNQIIETDIPKTSIIPIMLVQTPYDASVKSLLIEILRNVDEKIGTKYYEFALKKNLTIDSLVGQVSNVALNHLGVLVLDEVQNCIHAKKGDYLIRCLTQLINSSGISICLSGTPEAISFLEREFQIARRTLGLSVKPFEYDDEFFSFCNRLFNYQYTLNYVEFNEVFAEWLYNHSLGNASVVISLFHDSQELSIMDGSEIISIANLENAFKKRLTLLNGFIETKTKTVGKLSKKEESSDSGAFLAQIEHNQIRCAVEESKGDERTLFNLLCKLKITIEEVKIC